MWPLVVAAPVLLIALFATTTATELQAAGQRAPESAASLLLSPIDYGEPRVYCETDTFQPRCSAGEVLRIGIATYGRERKSRCIWTNYGFIGCVKDVRNYVDGMCSGRPQCKIRIPDGQLDLLKNCPGDLKTYLNVSYACVKVETKACAACHRSEFAKVTHASAYLSSHVTFSSDFKCGTANCPWLVDVQPGQKIQIILMDFATKVVDNYVPDVHCTSYGVVKEADMEETPICGGVHGTRHVYTSISHSVIIQIFTPLKNNTQFLLHYQAIGCPSFKKPPNAWIKREDDVLTIGCHSSKDKWQMKCEGTTWKGDIRTCPQDHKARDDQRPANMSLPLGVLVAIVIGIALIVGVLILTIGVVFLKRQQHELTARHGGGATMYYRAPQTPPYLLEEIEVVEQAQPECTCPKPSGSRRRWEKHQQPSAQRVNLYARRMESRPLPSLPNLAESESEGADLVPVQVYRTHSGHREHRPRCIAAAGAPPVGVDPQYFELDPDGGAAAAPLPSAQAARRAARAANARTAAHAMARGKNGRRQKSPEEENAENFDKEEHLNGSCQELPSKSNKNAPSKASGSSGNNNYSWP